jgi:PDZ domain-containing protein
MSSTEPTLSGPPSLPEEPPFLPAGHPPPNGRPGRGRVVGAVIAAAAVVGVLVGIASHEASGYFLFSPGTAPLITASSRCQASRGEFRLPDGSPCVRLLVPKQRAHQVNGGFYMVDVEVGQAGAFDWLLYQFGLLGGQHELVSVQSYAGNTPTSELGCQDTQQMVSADQNAALAAMSVLGYHVGETSLGAQIVTVFAGTPAWKAGLKCNDLVTAVDGKPVRTATALTDLLHPLPPGTAVTLTVKAGGRARTIEVKLGRATPAALAQGFDGKGYMGINVQTQVRPTLPFKVSVNAGSIGGPSAGLAFTLAMLDALSNGRLTGGHRVAATGTVDPSGNVGDVGGVREKTVAVEGAGAQVFFVPKVEYSAAVSQARGGLTVIPVTTLGQVLAILHDRYGGDLAGLKGVKAAQGA